MSDKHPFVKRTLGNLPFTFVGSVILAIVMDWHEGGWAGTVAGVIALALVTAAAGAVRTWMIDSALAAGKRRRGGGG